jgi:regulator of replication initiation timing
VTTPGAQQELNRRIDNTRQQISLLNTQMEQTQKRLEPASEFGAILRKNNGNLDAALREQQAREVERKQQEQAAGMQMAAQRAAETERGKKEAEETFKAGQTLLDIKPQESRQYVDVKTGAPLPQSSKYQATKDRMDKGEVVFLDDQEIKAYRDISKMVPLLTQIRGQIEKVYGPGGIFENLTPAQRFAASLTGGMARLTQSNPELTELNRNIKGNVDNLRRSLQGQVGTQTEQDAQRGIQALAKVDGIPDSKEVAYGMYNALLQSVNGMMQFYLGNPEFQHGKLTPLGMTRQVTGEAVEVQ